MKRYEPGTPRAIAGIAAICMTAATLAMSVVAPAAVDSESREVGVLTTSTQTRVTSSKVDGATTSIDVVALRGTRLVPVVETRSPAKANLSS
jgi:glutamate racemase